MLNFYKRIGLGLLLGWCIMGELQGQVLSVSPVFPKETDTITITYDAGLGNAALVGVSQVYAHAGVITNLSTSNSDWKHVVGTWGTADNRVKMTALGNNKWQMRYHVKNFYAQAGSFAGNEYIKQLAFVFRNADGSKVGRTSSGGDIFSPIYSNSSEFLLKVVAPEQRSLLVQSSDVNRVEAWTSKYCKWLVTFDGDTIRNFGSADSIEIFVGGLAKGKHWLKVRCDDGSKVIADSISFVVNGTVKQLVAPSGLEQGFTWVDDTTAYFALYAPYKNYVYVIGDFNQWQAEPEYFMNFSPSQQLWWVKVSGLKKGVEYAYQYWVDGKLRVADPFSVLMLHEWDDAYISASNFPNLKAYPKNLTSGYVSVVKPGGDGYQWKNTGFNRLNKDKLAIYECLTRDFTSAQSFKAIQDTLPYLKRLGITALQLMPVMEFEGNISWGYNISNHMALDKYYGNSVALKSLIDACHSMGIAVILDVVYNHAFGSASICQLYWDDVNSRPAGNSPYANAIAKHPFNVGNDLNHESSATKYYTKRTLQYWLEEFHVDGFRFDLSKGITQFNSGTNSTLMANYDQSRINILSDYNDLVQKVSPGAYVILEHFADNSEEQVLQGKGMMLWGNANFNALEAAMGFATNSDFGWGFDNTKRGWSYRHLIGYSCSHDEERLGYKSKVYGYSVNAQHNVKSSQIYAQRIGNINAFTTSIPGPKMFWQFDELAYDYSINYCTNGTVADACRLDPKPVRWDYWTKDGWRQMAYYKLAATNHLKLTVDGISSPNSQSLSSSGTVKRLNTYHSDVNMVSMLNIDINNQQMAGNFPHVGWWYDYLKGDSLEVTNVNQLVTLVPGEVKMYLDKRVENPYLALTYQVLAVEDAGKLGSYVGGLTLWPNPAAEQVQLDWDGMEGQVAEVVLRDLRGAVVKQVKLEKGGFMELSGCKSGMYMVELMVNGSRITKPLMISN